MSMSIDPRDSDGTTGGRGERTSVVLTVALAALLFVAATVALLVARQRSQQAALLAPAATATPAAPIVIPPGQTRPPAGQTPAQSPAVSGATRQPPSATPAQPIVIVPPGSSPRATSSLAPTVSPSSSPATGSETRAWFFAEGASVSPFRTWYSIYNPGSQPASVSVTLYPESGKVTQRSISVRAGGVERILANDLLPGVVFGAGFSSERAIYVERLMLGDRDGTSATAQSPATKWYFGEGETALEDYTTWLLVLNPGTSAASITVTYLIDRPGAKVNPVVRTYTAPPQARLTIAAHRDVPSEAMGIIVESDRPVVVEQALYFDDQKAAYGGSGLASLSKTWYVPSANLQERFATRLSVLNPGEAEAKVTVSLTGGGDKPSTVSTDVVVSGRGRTDLVLNEMTGEPRLAVVLQSTQPIAVHVVSYYLSGGERDPIAAYSAPAIPGTATQWYLPETVANAEFDPYLAVFNPGIGAAVVTVIYATDGGETLTRTLNLPAQRSQLLRVLDDAGGKTVLAAAVRSTQSVVVDRVTMFRRTVGASASAGIVGQ